MSFWLKVVGRRSFTSPASTATPTSTSRTIWPPWTWTPSPPPTLRWEESLAPPVNLLHLLLLLLLLLLLCLLLLLLLLLRWLIPLDSLNSQFFSCLRSLSSSLLPLEKFSAQTSCRCFLFGIIFFVIFIFFFIVHYIFFFFSLQVFGFVLSATFPFCFASVLHILRRTNRF